MKPETRPAWPTNATLTVGARAVTKEDVIAYSVVYVDMRRNEIVATQINASAFTWRGMFQEFADVFLLPAATDREIAMYHETCTTPELHDLIDWAISLAQSDAPYSVRRYAFHNAEMLIGFVEDRPGANRVKLGRHRFQVRALFSDFPPK